MYWFKWHCHANDAGALYSHNNSEDGNEKLAKTEPKQMCLPWMESMYDCILINGILLHQNHI